MGDMIPYQANASTNDIIQYRGIIGASLCCYVARTWVLPFYHGLALRESLLRGPNSKSLHRTRTEPLSLTEPKSHRRPLPILLVKALVAKAGSIADSSWCLVASFCLYSRPRTTRSEDYVTHPPLQDAFPEAHL